MVPVHVLVWLVTMLDAVARLTEVSVRSIVVSLPVDGSIRPEAVSSETHRVAVE